MQKNHLMQKDVVAPPVAIDSKNAIHKKYGILILLLQV
jgi:hypothetical protein